MGAVTLVATESQVDTSPNVSTSYTLATAPTSGNALVVCAGRYNENDPLASVSDNGGGSWALLKAVPYTSGGGWNTNRLEAWVCYDVQPGTTQITLTYNNLWNGENIHIFIAELAGIEPSSGQALRHRELVSPGTTRTIDTDSIDGTSQLASSYENYIALCFAISVDFGGAPVITAQGAWVRQGHQVSTVVRSALFTRIATAIVDPETITVDTDGSDHLDACLFLIEGLNPPTVVDPDDNALPGYGEGGGDITWTSGDAVHGNRFRNDGNTLLLLQNTSGAPIVVTVTGRSRRATMQQEKDIVVTIAGNALQCAGPFPAAAFNDSGGFLVLEPLSALINLATVRLPRGR